VLGGVAGRLLPLDDATARYLVDEVAAKAGSLRGQRPWPVEPLVEVVHGIAKLWTEHGGWLAAADVNPLIITEDGVVAVDVLLTVRENGVEA
jgi:succinyl-CoA synthetase beta subunit